jgi:heat shock protein HslJ
MRKTTSLLLISIPILAVALAACSGGGQSQTLEGTNWVLESLRGKSALSEITVTAGFQVDGRTSGSAGCNNYNAIYEVDGDNISIGPAAATRMFCPEPKGIVQEVQYLAVLETASTYLIEVDKMEIRTAEGALAATFRTAGD